VVGQHHAPAALPQRSRPDRLIRRTGGHVGRKAGFGRVR